MTDYRETIKAQLAPPGDFAACFAMSVHKAGSTLLHNMIKMACRRQRIPCANIPTLLFNESLRDAEWNTDRSLLPFFEDGRVYIGFRLLPPIFHRPSILQERQSVLLVRDPRDALVSQYFSFGGRHASHKVPRKGSRKLTSSWESTAHLDIDAYVLHAAAGYLDKLVAYQHALDFGKVLLRRYEDIYYDKRTFLAEIFRHFGLDIRPGVVTEVAREFDVRPEAEQRGKHIRKGTPGDHRDKLRPETIERLNDLFAPACAEFGYRLGAPAGGAFA